MKKVFIYHKDQLGTFWKEAFEFETCIIDQTSATFYKNGEIIGSIPLSTTFKIEEL